MANDLKILITGSLNQSATITEINRAISQIAKDPSLKKLNVNIAVSDTQIASIARQITKIQEQINNKPIKIVPETNFKEVFTSIDQAIAKYEQLGSIKVTKNFDTATGDLNTFTLQVTKATGEVDKLKFELASLKNIQVEGMAKAFIPTQSTTTDNTQAILERQLQQQQQINSVIDQRSQTLKDQIQIYQRQAELQATNLKNNPNKILSSDQQVALQNYLTSVRSLTSTIPNVQIQMRNLSQDFREISTQAETASSSSMTFGSALQQAFEKFPIWMVASTAFFQTFNFFKDGIQYVNQLDQALTQISIVTSQNQSSVAALGEQYNKLAESMGVTTTEIANEATELYRQGLSQDQVESRMKIITEYAKISSLDTKTASEIMTAAINSMGVSATRAADVWSYLGDATATGKHMCPVLQ